MQNTKTYLLVGTVTKDLLPNNNFTTGGTVTYSSVVAKELGWQPVIITKAALDFTPPSYLADVDWRILPASNTTTFHNEYDEYGNRCQTIGPVGDSITPEDIPVDCQQASLVHLCPLAQDLYPSVTTVFNNSLLVATPQGWLRQWNTKGIVSLGEWDQSDKILPQLKIVVISLEDVEGKWSIAEEWATQIPILIVTQGNLGCTVLHKGQKLNIPARPANVVDPTGAGDVFATAFFLRFYETNDIKVAAYFANVTASMAIERFGPEGVPDRTEIEAYITRNPIEIE